MPEISNQSPLTEAALARLRTLAEGNGLAPEEIRLINSDEKIYTLNGLMTLMPFCEVGGGRYAGPPQGKDRKIVSDLGALHKAAETKQQEFLRGSGWLVSALADLKAEPGEGWGLDGVRIELPDWSAVFAASGPCPTCQGTRTLICQQCQGQGFVVCAQCQGRKQEACYNCAGRGENPLHQGQLCPICHGNRFTPCRFCNAMGQRPCPTCQGNRALPCGVCRGSGLMTEEVTLFCGATTQFRISSDEEMPSGLRRGLDRLGPVNLTKGHADVAPLPQAEEETPLADTPNETAIKQPQSPVLHYRVRLPYADMHVSFGAKKARIGVFGKRGSLLDVPTFLDDALQPWRDKLLAATTGTARIEDAMDARAMRDALKLTIEGHTKLEAMKRLYSVGMSAAVIKEILTNMRRALNHHTLHVRSSVAAFCFFLGTSLFLGIFMTGIHAKMTAGWSRNIMLGFDLALPFLVMALSWIALTFSVRLTLQKRFRDFKIPLLQKTGKIGFSMLLALLLAYLIVLFLTPAKPLWLMAFLLKH